MRTIEHKCEKMVQSLWKIVGRNDLSRKDTRDKCVVRDVSHLDQFPTKFLFVDKGRLFRRSMAFIAAREIK